MSQAKSIPSLHDLYHDYYDLALMPLALGDIITWGIKSAMRSDVGGKKRTHVHLICDREGGVSLFHDQSYAADHFTFEILPAFTSNPRYSGITVHRSRADFTATMERLLGDDPVNRENYRLHLSRFENRHSNEEVGKEFRKLCATHEDINELHERTGSFPKARALEDFAHDIKNLKAEFPPETYWVSVQFRLRILDTGMPCSGSPDAYLRDAPFLHWYHFLRTAGARFPQVKFIMLGRLQEKPLEILRLPNVLALRPLGMNIGHEFAALLDSDLFMGSPSGFSQLAQLSDVPYNIVNCTREGCLLYDIPYGTSRLPFAQPAQHLYYGKEDSALLLEAPELSIKETPKKEVKHEPLQLSRTGTTHRFYITDDQSHAEVLNSLAGIWQQIALMLDRRQYQEARKELSVVEESFPQLIGNDTRYQWLAKISGHFSTELADGTEKAEWRQQAHDYARELSRFLHPSRIVRQSGRFLQQIPLATGLDRDGWCQQEVRIVFAPSSKGSFVILHFLRIVSDEPLPLTVRLNQQTAVEFTLLNEPCVIEVAILDDYIHTELTLNFGYSAPLHSHGTISYSAQIERGGIVVERAVAPVRYVPNKSQPSRCPSAGIYTTGAASSHVWLRIDNPAPDIDAMVHLIGYIPRKFRKGQNFSIQINDRESQSAVICGKHVEAFIPCRDHPKHVAILMHLTDKVSGQHGDLENRLLIKCIEMVPTTGRPGIISGFHGFLSYLSRRLRSKSRSRN